MLTILSQRKVFLVDFPANRSAGSVTEETRIINKFYAQTTVLSASHRLVAAHFPYLSIDKSRTAALALRMNEIALWKTRSV